MAAEDFEMYEDIIESVTSKTSEVKRVISNLDGTVSTIVSIEITNPLGNDLTRGIYCIKDHYDLDLSKYNEECECFEACRSLRKEIEFHRKNPGKTLYYSPKEIRLFGTKIDKIQYILNIPEEPSCTGKCHPRSEYEIMLIEVKNIISNHRSGVPYMSSILHKKELSQ